MNMILVMQIFSSCLMAGAIWLVQILVYPNFLLIESENFQKFHQFHINRITWIVAPVMGIELTTGIWLCFYHASGLYICNLLSILFVWMITRFVSVPIHNRLEKFPTAKNKEWLILTNWPRTLIWTLRSVCWLWILQNQDLGFIS